ncbi:hypothetical protein TTHERM_00475200 (macronuclear) [Tetrahymena thermophila SB210]|uniref:KKT2/KKT3 zinc finger domain-containing protein n=1 Tax=Tetrahymena thermophila (strain SB210) TaxID=312017 RepID=I7LX48_TETTS|nr:hypothetical protein TTHERM_00475200 [Tetrahymena thermophila SB210]EAS03757.1 hypothetical protein TTHERM_00475200 [Tetrahymena thermophila SB210]|eukprot:XP_001024002.1 hypothetical protein TTHERM_00475200 [Tetrahymena thermophila SB210]
MDNKNKQDIVNEKEDLQKNIQDQTDNPDVINQKKSKRFKKCLECDEYYEIIDNKSDHNCIRALRERIVQQQEQINNMVTKEQVAEILKGYVSQDSFLNFIRATEKKFSELFHSMNSHEELLNQNKKQITKCPTGHLLQQLTGQRLVSVTCDICLKRALDRGNHTQRCEVCNFDICASCESIIQKTKCKNGHGLNPVNPSDYDQLQCNNCLKVFSNTESYSFRCKQCDYDLCQKCIQINTTKDKEKKSLLFF